MWNRLSLMILLTVTISIVESIRKSGPYDVKLETLEACEDQGSRKIVFNIKMSNAGKGKYVIKDNFTIGVLMDDKLKSVLEMQRWGNGGWKRRYVHHTFKNCEEFFGFLRGEIQGLMKAANTTMDECPIPMGNYTVHDWTVHFNVVTTFPVMEYGKYKVIFQWYHEDEFVGCHTTIVDIVPKDSSQL